MTHTLPPLRYRTVFGLCLAVAVFGCIPGMGLPGALLILVLSPLPYISVWFESLQGDAGWGAAILMTIVGPAVAWVVYVTTYGVLPRFSSVRRMHLFFWVFLLCAWYASALVVLGSYAKAQLANPDAGTMMEYLR